MTKEEQKQLIEMVKENIKTHMEEINWKKKHNHWLTYTDKVLLLSETELMIKIEEWEATHA